MIEPGAAVKEIWDSRDQIWEDVKNMSPIERASYFKKKGDSYATKYGFKHYSPEHVAA
ncbi:MAG: hypothetical protein JNL74_02585 [Fibrobacteres bacterium]|jgi:hypothetical protein|nr:hypothetical protein [Fibrobacterota bacterium]